MKKFEYFTITPVRDVQIRLNKLGRDGWELITVSVSNTIVGIQYHYFFKREIE